MIRIPIILAGVAAAAILMRITSRRKKDTTESGKNESFKVYNIKPGVTIKPVETDTRVTISQEKQETDEIFQIKRLRLPEKLEAMYPGLKNIETKEPVAQR